MGRLELPLPELGRSGTSLEAAAKEMQKRIRADTPGDLRNTVVVRPFKKGAVTGLAIDYDDRAENHVIAALEYPKGGTKKD